MKQINQLFTSILASLLLGAGLTSCVDDELIKKGNVVEGEPVTMSINLSFVPQTDVVVTKADNSLSDITDLTLFIYSGDGTFQQVVSTTNGLLTLGNASSENTNPDGVVRGRVTFESTSGTKQLLAVANIGSNSVWSALSTEAMQGNLTFEQLKKEVVDMSTNQYNGSSMSSPIGISSGSQMLMTGWNTGVEFSPSGTIGSYGERGVESQQVVVRLDRSLARITFNIPAAPDGSKGTFTPTSYRIYNIPVSTYLINTDYNSVPTGESAWNFVHTESANIGGVGGENDTYTFTFYMPENIYDAVDGVTGYKERDTWGNSEQNTTTSPEAKQWNKAPQTSTFVVISGTYVGVGTTDDGTSHNYTGNVSYTVHLGDFSDGKWGNYSVKRNWSYTYNMSVLSVDNIVVEVEAKGDDEDSRIQQGAEGDIFDYSDTQYTYALDAHYEQVFLEYDLTMIANSLEKDLEDKELDDAIANNLILVIQSEAMDYSHLENENEPYSVQNKRGTLRPYKIYADAVRNGSGTSVAVAKTAVMDGTPGSDEDGFDYKWIEFWPQSGTTLAQYPGVSSWSKADLSGLSNKDVYGGSPIGNTKRLKDVYDIIVGMGKAVKRIYTSTNGSITTTGDTPNDDGICIVQDNDHHYVARFTAFVNEYFYYKHPLSGASLSSWDVFVNKIPREMTIAMSTERSLDGNSSLSKVYSYISQVSMETFYNSRNAAINAFGIETYNETPSDFTFNSDTSLEYQGGHVVGHSSEVSIEINNQLTSNDGHANQVILLGDNLTWSNYINTGSNGWTRTETSHKLPKDAYKMQYAYAACMSRNRDLNGNGQIDKNEIRWYLPSVNEYIRIGIGSNALTNTAQLYTGNKSAMTRGGYPGSYLEYGALYYTSSQNNARLYWPIEVGSYGTDGESWAGGTAAKPIRCIRALPAQSANTDISTVNVVSDATYEKIDGPGVLATLRFENKLVSDLYRGRIENDFEGTYYETDDANAFYNGIFVASKNLAKGYYLYELNGYGIHGRTNPCATYKEGGYSGWRLPNLVELSAMNAAGLLSDGDYVTCSTLFTNQSVRYGFAHSTLIYCPGSDTSDLNWGEFKVRCVRDVPNGYNFGN